jgi:5-(carboxyamino)imidazole ribonucleotide synthase
MGQATDRFGTLGILGGGQLARMTALAARRLGHATHVLDPSKDCPAATVVDQLLVGPLESEALGSLLASRVDVVAIDTEHIPLAVLRAAAERVPTSPSADVLGLVQDKCVQKAWLSARGYPVTKFAVARDEPELARARELVQGRRFVKRACGGYDGRGQLLDDGTRTAAAIIQELGSTKLLVEQAVSFDAELSVLVARTSSGAMRVYPPSFNHHTRGILSWSVFPAPLPERITRRARAMASSLADDLALTGLLCVEMFLRDEQELLVNELAPRPHNSYHGSEQGCETSQFEQLVRAACGLSLGSVEVVKPTAICNLLGDLWTPGEPLAFGDALADPAVTLHLYGKGRAQPGRKMGHLAATGRSPQIALGRVLKARDSLTSRARSGEQAGSDHAELTEQLAGAQALDAQHHA